MEIEALKASHTKKELWSKYKSIIIDDVANHLQITLDSKQSEIINSSEPYKIIKAARRSGKSFTAAFMLYCKLWFGGLFDYQMDMIVAAPRGEDSIKIFEYMQIFLKQLPLSDMFPSLTITYDNWKTPTVKKKELKFKDGSKVASATCDSPYMDDIRKHAFDFVIAEEFGNIKYKADFLNTALPSLQDQNKLNEMLVIGTPDIGMGREFDDLFKAGQDDKNIKIKSWHLKREDNTHLDKSSGQDILTIMSEEGRQREIEGESVPRFGRMFNDFTFKDDVKDTPYNPDLPLLIGIDFGFRKPAVIYFQVEEATPFPMIYVINEDAPKDTLIDALIGQIRTTLSLYGRIMPVVIGCDKAGDQANTKVSYTDFGKLKEHFHMANYTCSPALINKGNQVNLLLTLTKAHRIQIDPKCEALIGSFSRATYWTDIKGQIIHDGWKKDKGIDDPLDGFMYGMINYGLTSCLILNIEPEEDELSDNVLSQAVEGFFS